jgi:lipoyl(octanoyl) transferase
MKFHLLPVRTGSAAENMAADLLLLQAYPAPDAIRFRHYEWRNPAITFGYSQKWNAVSQYPSPEYARRPTGGGIVDHTDDWTYCLVVPREHPFFDRPAPFAYRAIHEALAEALRQQGVAGALQPAKDGATAGPATACFQQAETHDVILLPGGAKLAGAAMKRNKNGLLFQASLTRALPGPLDWDLFEEAFPSLLARALGAEIGETPWPDWDPDQESSLIDRFSSADWNERR